MFAEQRYCDEMKPQALCNTPDDVIVEYIKVNGARGLPFLPVQTEREVGAVLVGGGPSLSNTLTFVRAFAEAGATVFAINNAANYLKERGIEADWQIIIDSRPENLRFVKDFPAKGYIVSAQCHPSLFDHLAGKNLMIFYPTLEGIRDVLPRETDKAPLINGMITSGLQALSVCYTLGYRAMHLHGYDSSDADNGDAHAYPQDENKAEKKRLDVMFNGKSYRSSFAMYKQAEEFETCSRMFSDYGATIHVYGEGLLPDIAHDIAAKGSAA